MKCEIIKDLLPGLCDGVCSKESEEEILSHFESCAECKGIYESCKDNIDAGNVNKEAAPRNPFIKIRKALFKSKLIMAALGLVLLVFLCIAGVLLYWQYMRFPDRPSFETIAFAKKAEKTVTRLAEGDIDYFTGNIVFFNNDGDMSLSCIVNADGYLKDMLAELYNGEFKGKNIEIIRGRSGYGIGDPSAMRMMPSVEIKVRTDSGREIDFTFAGDNGVIRAYGIDDNRKEHENSLVNNINFAMNPSAPDELVNLQIINSVKIAEENSDLYAIGFSGLFAADDDEAESFRQKHIELLENGEMLCESFECGDLDFDVENQRYITDMTVVFLEQPTGKRIMYRRTIVINNYYSYAIVPEYEPIIIDDGISGENRQNLIRLFPEFCVKSKK